MASVSRALFRTMASSAAPKRLPSVKLFEGTPAGAVNIADLAKGKRVVVFGVPGAFTPGCSKTHLPGYVEAADAIKAKGIDEIICTSVNDPFVHSAWGEAHGAGGKVRMLADTNAEFAKALGVDMELAALGGVRSKRYALLAEDGEIKEVNVEPDNTGLSCSLAKSLLDRLK